MKLARSKITAQGQISVPAAVRQALGVGPGSVLEWESDGERVIIRRTGKFTSQDIHHVLFKTPPKPKTLGELKAGIARHAKRRARR